MKYWKLLGYESEPKGIGKIISISKSLNYCKLNVIN